LKAILLDGNPMKIICRNIIRDVIMVSLLTVSLIMHLIFCGLTTENQARREPQWDWETILVSSHGSDYANDIIPI